jgi:hypothetical protein
MQEIFALYATRRFESAKFDLVGTEDVEQSWGTELCNITCNIWSERFEIKWIYTILKIISSESVFKSFILMHY